MANVDAPQGLIPIRHKNGEAYNGAVNPYYIASTYATSLKRGDPIIITGTSNATAYLGYEPGTLPEIEKATAAGGNYTSGVVVGFKADPDNLDKSYNVKSNERIAFVADDPDLVFEVQEDGDGSALDEDSVGLNADYVFTHAGSTTTGISGVELDRSTINTTNTLQMKILRLSCRIGNSLGDSAVWEVMLNLHTQRYLTGI